MVAPDVEIDDGKGNCHVIYVLYSVLHIYIYIYI